MNSHNLNQIQPVESDRKSFTSATDVLCLKIRRSSDKPNRLSSGRTLNIYPSQKTTAIKQIENVYVVLYSENGDILLSAISRVIFVKEVRSGIPMVPHACHDNAMSGGHLAYKQTFGNVRYRFWWPTLYHDAKSWCNDCPVCQRRKLPHRLAKLPTGHLLADCSFQRVLTDLVEYKTK